MFWLNNHHYLTQTINTFILWLVLLLLLPTMVKGQEIDRQKTNNSRLTIFAQPSFKTVSPEQKPRYYFAQSHGYCNDVLMIEREGLISSRPEFEERFGKNIAVTQDDRAALEKYALGFRRCRALRQLAKVFSIPKLKAGETQFQSGEPYFAKFAPKPRLGSFLENGSEDLKKLLIDRGYPNGLDRPLDWVKDPMPLTDEVLLHSAYTELVTLAVCHTVLTAFEDIGKFYDQNFSTVDPYVNYGLFKQALLLNVDTVNMNRRMKNAGQLLPEFIRLQLDEAADNGKLHKHPRLDSVFRLCPLF